MSEPLNIRTSGSCIEVGLVFIQAIWRKCFILQKPNRSTLALRRPGRLPQAGILSRLMALPSLLAALGVLASRSRERKLQPSRPGLEPFLGGQPHFEKWGY